MSKLAPISFFSPFTVCLLPCQFCWKCQLDNIASRAFLDVENPRLVSSNFHSWFPRAICNKTQTLHLWVLPFFIRCGKLTVATSFQSAMLDCRGFSSRNQLTQIKAIYLGCAISLRNRHRYGHGLAKTPCLLSILLDILSRNFQDRIVGHLLGSLSMSRQNHFPVPLGRK